MVKNKIQNQLVLEINEKSIDWKVSEIFQEVKNIALNVSKLEKEVVVLQIKNDNRYLAIDKKIDDSDDKTEKAFVAMSAEVQSVKLESILNKSDITKIVAIISFVVTMICSLFYLWVGSKLK